MRVLVIWRRGAWSPSWIFIVAWGRGANAGRESATRSQLDGFSTFFKFVTEGKWQRDAARLTGFTFGRRVQRQGTGRSARQPFASRRIWMSWFGDLRAHKTPGPHCSCPSVRPSSELHTLTRSHDGVHLRQFSRRETLPVRRGQPVGPGGTQRRRFPH